MKRFFEEPLVEIAVFTVEDVVTVSEGGNPDWTENIPGGVQ